ncbi:MAG: NAD-dependent DNA ligase LigA, partial [Chloroflexi bacterium]|nr:NAD-dependent DNA ligase LigA [Chloroflexota bacterium]
FKVAGVWPEAEFVDPGRTGNLPLEGKSFVLTGKLQSLSRTELKDVLQSLGGRVIGSVSSKTDYVVVGEDPGSKFTKAQDLGLKILSENELKILLEMPPE